MHMDPLTVHVAYDRPSSAAQRDLAFRHLQGVSSLYAVRADLRGVHAFADVVEESVRWSA
jgi:hypothetical protein